MLSKGVFRLMCCLADLYFKMVVGVCFRNALFLRHLHNLLSEIDFIPPKNIRKREGENCLCPLSLAAVENLETKAAMPGTTFFSRKGLSSLFRTFNFCKCWSNYQAFYIQPGYNKPYFLEVKESRRKEE